MYKGYLCAPYNSYCKQPLFPCIINQLLVIIEVHRILCKVRTEYASIMQIHFGLRRVSYKEVMLMTQLAGYLTAVYRLQKRNEVRGGPR
jgi:hypothetical protein